MQNGFMDPVEVDTYRNGNRNPDLWWWAILVALLLTLVADVIIGIVAK